MARYCFLFFCLLIVCTADAQGRFVTVDRKARATGYYPLPQLAQRLTSGYTDEEDKVRSIFIWITAHIAYDIKEFKKSDSLRYGQFDPPEGDSLARQDLWERHLAAYALKDKMAVCEGDASLFKVLCKEAGLEAAVITGYARSYEDIGKPYEENHVWNAVRVLGAWQLMDVTWAAGKLNAAQTKVAAHFDPHYYNTPPEKMIWNHYPVESRWLLGQKRSRQDFVNAPYRIPDSKVVLQDLFPKNGLLKKKKGDSIVFILKTEQACRQVLLYDEGMKRWSTYESAGGSVSVPVRQPGDVAASPVKAAATRTSEKDPAIDAMLAYVDTTTEEPVLSVTPVIPAPAPPAAPVLGPLTFTRNNDRIRLVYRVKDTGRRYLRLFLDREPVAIYLVDCGEH